jgi:hypothetical protein
MTARAYETGLSVPRRRALRTVVPIEPQMALDFATYAAKQHIAAEAAKADGIKQASENASTRWKQAAFDAVCWCAEHFAVFTTDEVWERMALAHADPIETERHPAAMGPVMLRAQKLGKIVPSACAPIPSRFSRRHRKLTVWERAA